MNLIINILLIFLLIIFLGSFLLSFCFTHRYYLKNPSSPADVGLLFEEVINLLNEEYLRCLADFIDKNL
jgi:hypothetical protein